jgi:hypothetical protein
MTILFEAAMPYPANETMCCGLYHAQIGPGLQFSDGPDMIASRVAACAPPNAFLDPFDGNNELELFTAQMHLVR